MNTILLDSRHLRRGALLAMPLAVAALALNVSPNAIAVETPAAATPRFERVQFADVIEAVQPAVVQIAVTKVVGGMARLDGTPDADRNGAFEEFMRRFGRGPFAILPGGEPQAKAEGVGSGFIVDRDGYIVTNNHVIENATEMTVTLHDGRSLPARLIGSDPLTDLALIKVDGKSLPAIAFGDSDRARVGDWVVAIGSPFGFGGSVTAGIISARGRDIRSGPYDDYLQIDAPINSGNSGGPIVDASGKVVGVNTAIFSPNGGNIGIGFAIPAAEAARVVADLKDKGSVTRGWLGVQIQGVTPDVAEAMNLKESKGALVADVIAGGPAARAGVKVGDVITRFDAARVDDPRDLSRAVAHTEPGSKSSLTVIRKGREERLVAVIDKNASAPQPLAANDTSATEDTLGLGLALGSLNADTRAQMNLDETVSGALVLGIKSGGSAESSGIRPGDVIVQVNQQSVADAGAAEQALATAKQQERPAVVLIRRGSEQFFTTMKLA